MTTAERFLDLYKQLEEAISVRYSREGKSTASPVRDYMQDPEAQSFKERLDLMRQIRNLLSHNAMVDGETPVMPSDGITDELEDILEFVKRPPMAMERAVPYSKLLTARKDTNVVGLMKMMGERGYSHVPVLGGGRVMGVFSVSTLFNDMLSGGEKLNEFTTMQRFLSHIEPEKHVSETFALAGPELTMRGAAGKFERRAGEKRVAAVLITEDGTSNSKLLAMLTPWDLLTPAVVRKRR